MIGRGGRKDLLQRHPIGRHPVAAAIRAGKRTEILNFISSISVGVKMNLHKRMIDDIGDVTDARVRSLCRTQRRRQRDPTTRHGGSQKTFNSQKYLAREHQLRLPFFHPRDYCYCRLAPASGSIFCTSGNEQSQICGTDRTDRHQPEAWRLTKFFCTAADANGVNHTSLGQNPRTQRPNRFERQRRGSTGSEVRRDSRLIEMVFVPMRAVSGSSARSAIYDLQIEHCRSYGASKLFDYLAINRALLPELVEIIICVPHNPAREKEQW